MTASSRQYWVFRVDRRHPADLDGELENGRLRQGWGWDPRQDLRNMILDEGAGRNQRMREEVKQGDRILIPHLPAYGHVTIGEATQNWIDGYHFSIWDRYNDYGHIFPAKRLLNFRRNNSNVPAALRDTFRNPSRFWNINYLGPLIEDLLSRSPADLESASSIVERWQAKIEKIIEEADLSRKLHEAAQAYTSKADWEFLLTNVLQQLNEGWEIERTGGRAEAEHGTDILAKIPDVFGDGYYGIAIQIKDYRGLVGDRPLDQIRRAANYWEKQGIKILQLVVVLIDCGREENPGFIKSAAMSPPVRIVWAADVQQLLNRAAWKFVAQPDLTLGITP